MNQNDMTKDEANKLRERFDKLNAIDNALIGVALGDEAFSASAEQYEALFSQAMQVARHQDTVIAAKDAEIERWSTAYEKAHNQAMANGSKANRFREALEDIAGMGISQSPAMNMPNEDWLSRLFSKCQRIAKQALEQGGGDG